MSELSLVIFFFSGEKVFKKMLVFFGWVKFFMIYRISGVDRNIFMIMIYGLEFWMDGFISYEIKYFRSGSYVDV